MSAYFGAVIANTNTSQYAAADLGLKGVSTLGNQGQTWLSHTQIDSGSTEAAFNISQASYSGSYICSIAYYDYTSSVWQFKGDITPMVANSQNLGSTAAPWENGCIQNAWRVTSDRNHKCDFRQLTTSTDDTSLALLRVGSRLAKLVSLYKMKAAVEKKGASAARWHAGWLANPDVLNPTIDNVISAFEAEGLDAFAYGCVGFDLATKAVTTLVTISQPRVDENGQPVLDASGAPIMDNVERSFPKQAPDYEEDGVTQKKSYTARLEELTCLVIASQEARLAALEAKIAALEAPIAKAA